MTLVCHQGARCVTSSEAGGSRISWNATSSPSVACLPVDLAAPQEIVQPADPIPPITIGLDHEAMLAALVGAAVILGQEIDQELAVFGILFVQADGESDLMRLCIEVVNEEHP